MSDKTFKEEVSDRLLWAFPDCALNHILPPLCPYDFFGRHTEGADRIVELCDVDKTGLTACKKCWDMKVSDFYD